jgi:hypothetical protein
MAHPPGSTRSVIIAAAAGTTAALAVWMRGRGFSGGGYLVHQAVVAILSLFLWSTAYLLLHRALVFLSAVLRPLFAPLWSVVWFVITLPFLFWSFVAGPEVGEYVLTWAEAACWFTGVTALVHFLLLLAEGADVSPAQAASPSSVVPPAPGAAEQPPPARSSDVSLSTGLLLATPAMIVGGAASFWLHHGVWLVGDGSGEFFKALFCMVPIVFGAGLYLGVYLLLLPVRPLHRPLWAPLWGLGWFILTPLCAFLFYAAFMGFMMIAMAYVCTSLTALVHFLLMLGWRQCQRLKAA